MKALRGQVFTDESYDRLQVRVANELFTGVASQEQVIQQKKENLVASVRRQVERELADERAALDAHAAAITADLEARATDVAAREREGSPSYRAAFAAAGAGLTLVLDVLIRLVA
jgi:hypothetical protein